MCWWREGMWWDECLRHHQMTPMVVGVLHCNRLTTTGGRRARHHECVTSSCDVTAMGLGLARWQRYTTYVKHPLLHDSFQNHPERLFIINILYTLYFVLYLYVPQDTQGHQPIYVSTNTQRSYCKLSSALFLQLELEMQLDFEIFFWKLGEVFSDGRTRLTGKLFGDDW